LKVGLLCGLRVLKSPSKPPGHWSLRHLACDPPSPPFRPFQHLCPPHRHTPACIPVCTRLHLTLQATNSSNPGQHDCVSFSWSGSQIQRVEGNCSSNSLSSAHRPGSTDTQSAGQHEIPQVGMLRSVHELSIDTDQLVLAIPTSPSCLVHFHQEPAHS
jgi:hypothetical protein